MPSAEPDRMESNEPALSQRDLVSHSVFSDASNHTGRLAPLRFK